MNDSKCTAHVGNGITIYATSSTTTRTLTTTRKQYYYWTVTWYYYYYSWTYSAVISASIVTSTRTSTTSILSVSTTAAAAASSYFSSVSQTRTLSTPASATGLASLTGATRKDGAGGDPGPAPTDSPTGDDIIVVGNSSPAARTTSAGAARTDHPDIPGVAAALWTNMNSVMAMFLGLGLGIGAIAVML
ncbi:hypothetical protein QQS21_001340 [Conoideocrella luteorostrata]|uniref:Uncharacterized protein n=1 Tax=Conoideocrella luteorostrata TaxID=1105319 RepID=A0AAJ0G223_9HYPO|nr:hypothetical protein QQS21_001340 [Conoideocrella luteorostrata]